MTDELERVFVELPWLKRPDAWHPDAAPLVEEAKQLEPLLGGDLYGLEIWATLGTLTNAEYRERVRAVGSLGELIHESETEPAWPILARCLLGLASAPIPGRFYAANLLLDLIAKAHGRGAILTAEQLTALDGWDEEPRASLAEELRVRLATAPGADTTRWLYRSDTLGDAADLAEAALGR